MPAKIILDCERMKYPHTGLYHFCHNLSKHLLASSNPEKEEINFFLPANLKNVFGADKQYIIQKPWHKILLPNTQNYNVWHATHQDTDYFPQNKKIPLVLTIHDLNIIHNKSKSEEKKKKFLKDLAKKIKRADHITFISNFTKNDALQYVDIGNKPSTVIYNGCNIEATENLLSPLNYPTVPFYFTIGTIAEKKNFHVLPALLVGNDRLLIIAGITQSKEYKQLIIKEAIKHGVENRVIFTDAINENDKQWYYKNCEAFVFPSLTEGFGLPVVEAMFYGKPIFLSTFTSLPEIGGDVAYYFNSFLKEDMQSTVEQGLLHYKNTNQAEKIKARSSLFSWKHAAEQYLQVYRSLY